VEVGCPQRAAAKPRSVDYAQYISKLGHELGVLELGLRITTARAYWSLCIAAHNDHQHSGIRFVTPSERHDGRETSILEQRHCVYLAARKRYPRRWTGHTRNWTPIKTVRLNPEHGLGRS
jgi:hypothetical protein